MLLKTFIAFFFSIAPFPARAGGMVLALVVAAIVLAAALCASSAAGEIDRAMRLCWWFS